MRSHVNVALLLSIVPVVDAVAALSSFGSGGGRLDAWHNETTAAATMPRASSANSSVKFLQHAQAPVTGVLPPQPPFSCVPDLPGSFRTAGLTMLGGMLLVWTAVGFLMEQQPSPEEAMLAATAATAPRPARRPNIASLDGMRTLLITYIIVVHFPVDSPISLRTILADPGWSMQFFMVLSGFVACYVMEGKSDSFTWSSGCQWLGRRLARLAALHHLAIFLDYLRVAYTGGECAANGCRPLAAWPANAMFLQGLLPLRLCGMPTDHPSWNYVHFNANGVGWFAACLAWISVAFPFLYNHRPRSNMELQLGVLGAVIATRLMGEVWCPAWAMWGGEGVLHPYAFMPLRLLEFWAGMLSAQVAAQTSADVREWPYWGWVFDGSLVTGFAGVAYAMRYLNASAVRTGEYYMTPIWCLVCMAACLVVMTPEKERKPLGSGPIHQVLASSHVTYLAQYSYGAYQLHQVTLRWLFATGAPAFVQTFPANVVVGWTIGILSTLYIETPVMKFIEDSARALKPVKAASAQYT